MAIMYPSTLPDYIRRDPYREAEVHVYERLQAQLPNTYHCYYSRPWLGLTPEGEEREGEADFVVAHAQLGFLVIEVKGGGVSRVAGTEGWTSKNRLGITNRIKDPVQQASRSKYVLLEKLKEMGNWRGRYVTARHGVILPDCSRPRHALGANMPLWLFAFGEDFDNLKAWVDGRFGRDEDETDAPGRGLGQDGMLLINRLLAAAFELRPNLARALKEDHREIERLTRDQYDVLESLEDHPHMSISGGAGTGKTLLALEKACRLAEDGRRVLLTCYNESLGNHLAHLTQGFPTLLVGSFHSVCGKIARAASISLQHRGHVDDFYRTILPDALLRACGSCEDRKFDAVVIDEGQDFRDSWITTLRLCLRDHETGNFYVFYDDNQKVYSHPSGWAGEIPKSSYHLKKNLRNTKAIHLCAKPWYKGKATRCVGPEGQPVDWIAVSRHEDMLSKVKGAISDIINRQRMPPGDVAVLTGGRVDGHPLVHDGKIGGHQCVLAGTEKGKLVFDTVRRFKGLERSVVFVIDIEEIKEPELVYVSLTRSSVLLKVFGSPAAIARLQAADGVDD